MRGFREVERHLDNERIINEREDNNYLNIKPETNITKEDCNRFWNNLFNSMENAQ